MISPRSRAFLACTILGLALVPGCHTQYPKNYDADARSGPDGKRPGANVLRVNKSRTDEVSFANQDETDWYVVTLKGQPGVLGVQLHWDNPKTDLMVDVFDEFGKQLSSSPTRSPGSTQKTLLTQVDHVGVYYIRVTAQKPDDGSVYTLEAKWDEPEDMPPPPVVPVEPPPPVPVVPVKPKTHHQKEPAQEKPSVASETIQGHIVNAYRESGTLTIHIDKGAAAGVKVGMSGNVLSGPSGEDPVSGGAFKIVQVLDDRKSVARCSLSSVGKNTRVAITVK
jgi:hypothetical protein